jgi:excisionase family DNA binding protein
MLTKRETAALWNVSTRTVQQWVADGCPCFRHGTVLRFDEAEVRDWLRFARDAEPTDRALRRVS